MTAHNQQPREDDPIDPIDAGEGAADEREVANDEGPDAGDETEEEEPEVENA